MKRPVGPACKPKRGANVSRVVGSLYRGSVKLSDLRTKLLDASYGLEAGGPTPAKDQKIWDLVWNYLQVNKNKLTRRQLQQFSATLAWI